LPEQEEKKPRMWDMQYVTSFKQCYMVVVNKQKHAFCSISNPTTNNNVINDLTKENNSSVNINDISISESNNNVSNDKNDKNEKIEDKVCNSNSQDEQIQINLEINPNEIATELVKSIVKSFTDNKEILSEVFTLQETTKSQ